MILLVITGATGIATKVLKKNLEAIAKREIFNRFTTEDSCTWERHKYIEHHKYTGAAV
jgi:hypothetical protein